MAPSDSSGSDSSGSDSSGSAFVRRRPLLAAAVGGGVAAGALGVASRAGLLGVGVGDDAGGVLRLETNESGVDSLDVVLGDELLPSVGTGRWATGNLPTTTHSMAGFTWPIGDAEPVVEIGSKVGGVWQDWRRMPPLHDLPDMDTAESNDIGGTELVWIGDADGIRVRVRGRRPRDLTMVLLHPTLLDADLDPQAEPAQDAPQVAGRTSPTARAATPAPRPAILTRKQWGADPSLRSGSPTYNTSLVQVHVHHTADSNNSYSRADVPGMIRGAYRYHTQNLGWSDIGYNFLVDRFGRLWEGRAGGTDRLVRGAHTLGFNSTSTGVSVIGNFETAKPAAAVLDTIAGLAAWKLSTYGRDPMGRTSVRSEGSDKFSSGRVVSLPVIDGHRDTNDTACPGRNLYAQLPSIRTRTRDKIAAAPSTGGEPPATDDGSAVTVKKAFVLGGAMTVGTRLRVTGGQVSPSDATVRYQWRRDGVAIKGATRQRYVLTTDDVGAMMSVKVAGRSPGRTAAVQTLAGTTPVRARAEVRVAARARADRAVVVRTTVVAPGSSAPATGTVSVTMSGRTRTGTLVDGVVVVRFLKVPPGERTVEVVYPGDAATSPGVAEASVTTR